MDLQSLIREFTSVPKPSRGETWYAEMCGHDCNARQLRAVIDLLIDASADCVIQRRRAERLEGEHAYARVRAEGLAELSDELIAFSGRLRALENRQREFCREAELEYEAERQEARNA